VIIILDENLPPRWRDCLEAESHAVFHWTEIGRAGDADEVILDEALRRGA
jgi:predicted nuclease of predicted toxin-antitoxin system